MRYVEAVITIQKSHNHEKQPEKESQIRELKSICEELSRNISDNATIVDSKEKSVARILMYDTLNTIKIDTNEKSVSMIANEIEYL